MLGKLDVGADFVMKLSLDRLQKPGINQTAPLNLGAQSPHSPLARTLSILKSWATPSPANMDTRKGAPEDDVSLPVEGSCEL